MPAIITDDFRRNQARLLVNDIKASANSSFTDTESGGTYPFRGNNRYAIGLGKSDPWPADNNGISEGGSGFIVPSPEGTIQEDHDVISNLSVLKDVAAADAKQLIAKNPWTNGRKYKVYDEADDDMFYSTGDLYPCAVTENNKVYLCLSNTATSGDFSEVGASTVAPTAANNYGITNGGDASGYVWAHVADIDSSDSLTTNQFVPINPSPSPSVSPTEKQRTGGLLSHIGVTDGGSGYGSVPTVTLTGVKYDGTQSGLNFPANIAAKAIVEGGIVTRIDLEDSAESPDVIGSASYWSADSSTYLNSDEMSRLKYITVSFSGGSPTRAAKAYATVAPVDGFAANAINILPTWFVGINVDFENTETDGDAAIIDFRQVSLLKNFTREDDGENSSPSAAGASVLDALKYFEVSTSAGQDSNIANLNQGDIITNDVSKFYFDHADTSGTYTKIYYHQNSNAEVNLLDPVDSAEAFSGTDSLGYINSPGVVRPEYNAYDSPPTAIKNGEVIFHENRTPFARSSSQTEEVKLIIQL